MLATEKMTRGKFVSVDQFVAKTPGQKHGGYGREGAENRFHGGAIIHDATTGIICVDNQVSLGAGETISSKERFEEWLYKMASAEATHLHSDNSVFAADEFYEMKKTTHNLSQLSEHSIYELREPSKQSCIWHVPL